MVCIYGAIGFENEYYLPNGNVAKITEARMLLGKNL
jgi:hypothetical protein